LHACKILLVMGLALYGHDTMIQFNVYLFTT
jgi:hypothetical protein